MILIGKKVQKQVLKHLVPKEKAKILKRVKDYQEKLEYQWPDGIFEEYVKGESFPEHYPETIKKCIVCKEGYSLKKLLLTANYWKHSFYNRCCQENGVCPKCKEEESNHGSK